VVQSAVTPTQFGAGRLRHRQIDPLNSNQLTKGTTMLGKFFGKKASQTKANLHKVQNRDLMEAIVAGSIMVAFADGDCSDDELVNLEKLIQSNENLKHFGGDINTEIARFTAMFEAGPRMGKMKAMRELDDITASQEEKEEAFVMMLEIAEADGEIDDKEMTILKEVGGKFGIRLADFGL
jgi:tellurite resistance protein TerB